VALAYDPLGRLQTSTASGATTNFLYAGSMLIAEYDNSGNILRRYVPGPGQDEPAVWYEGAGTSGRRWLHADELGSIVAWSDGTGNPQATYGYGPYGEQAGWGGSRYSYTGQLMIPEARLYNYKARVYDPGLGRFLQTDPIGYASNVNAYAYSGNDSVNAVDPSGMWTRIDTAPKPPDPDDATPLSGLTVFCPAGSTCGEQQLAQFLTNYNNDIAISARNTQFAALGNVSSAWASAPPAPKPKPPQKPKPPCSSPDPRYYRCNASGDVEFTPQYQKEVCANYRALQDGAAKTNDTFTVTGGGSVFLPGNSSPIGGLLSMFSTLVSSITTGAGFRPFGITIVQPSAPPPGC
jgi:RHS repeat-associated protein